MRYIRRANSSITLGIGFSGRFYSNFFTIYIYYFITLVAFITLVTLAWKLCFRAKRGPSDYMQVAHAPPPHFFFTRLPLFNSTYLNKWMSNQLIKRGELLSHFKPIIMAILQVYGRPQMRTIFQLQPFDIALREDARGGVYGPQTPLFRPQRKLLLSGYCL
jgi:hypothetical protein